MNRKQVGLLVGIVLIVTLVINGVLPALACGGGPSLIGFDDPQAPKAIVQAAFGYLSQRLNTKLDPSQTPWHWQEDVFANTSLECPTAKESVDHTLTRGYRVTISVPTNGTFRDYFFVATKDGRVLFQCTNAGPGPQIGLTA